VNRIKNKEVSYNAIPTEELSRLFLRVVKDGEDTLIENRDYLGLFGQQEPLTASELWGKIAEVKKKSLSRKIAENWASSSSQEEKRQIYQELATCLESGNQYGR
jgi:hypothetical protein